MRAHVAILAKSAEGLPLSYDVPAGQRRHGVWRFTSSLVALINVNSGETTLVPCACRADQRGWRLLTIHVSAMIAAVEFHKPRKSISTEIGQ